MQKFEHFRIKKYCRNFLNLLLSSVLVLYYTDKLSSFPLHTKIEKKKSEK